MPGSVEAVPPAAACGRSVGARPPARLAKAGREEPIVGVSVAGIAAREGLAAKQARREMAPQRLEKVQIAPGIGMAPAGPDPQDLVEVHFRLRIVRATPKPARIPSPAKRERTGAKRQVRVENAEPGR